MYSWQPQVINPTLKQITDKKMEPSVLRSVLLWILGQLQLFS